MYDLVKDPQETTNIIDDSSYADSREAMKKDLLRYFQQVGAPPIEAWRTTTEQHLPWETKLLGGQQSPSA
jgi:hypothetical protein